MHSMSVMIDPIDQSHFLNNVSTGHAVEET